jgi:hypothetical protein
MNHKKMNYSLYRLELILNDLRLDAERIYSDSQLNLAKEEREMLDKALIQIKERMFDVEYTIRVIKDLNQF